MKNFGLFLACFLLAFNLGVVSLLSDDDQNQPRIKIGIFDGVGGGAIYLSDSPLAQGGEKHEAREEGTLKNTVECSYTVSKDGKSINAHYLIHKDTLQAPVSIDKTIPIEPTVVMQDIGYGFSAYAVLVK